MEPPMMGNILAAQIRKDIYDSLISRGLFPKEQEGCCKGCRRTGELLYIVQHIFSESKTRRKKSGYGVDWQKMHTIWSCKAVQDIRQSHKLYRETHENLESRIDSRREEFSWSKDPVRYISVGCTITITIRNSNDAIRSRILEMYKRIQTS